MSPPLDKCSLPPVFAVWRPRHQRWDFLKPVRQPRTGRLLRISVEWRPWTRSVLTTPVSKDTDNTTSEPSTIHYYEDIYRPRPPAASRPASAGPRKRIPLDPTPITYRRTTAYFTVWELEDRGIVSYQVPVMVFADWRVLPRLTI